MQMFASDFKKWAREVLRGRWGTAVAVCLVASILSGGVDLISGFFNTDVEQPLGMLELASNGAWPVLVTTTVASILVALVIGGALALGQTHYFTNLAAHRPSKFSNLFARFKIWYKGIWMNLVVAFFVSLWSLLGALPAGLLCGWWVMDHTPEGTGMILMVVFVMLASFPGWIAAYRYAMTPYILAEFPDISVMDALRESKRLMAGNKGRLFSLHLSFFGWILLVTFTFGIASIWLTPYMCTADAAFYLDVTGRSGLRYGQQTQEGS